ncbi:MAG: PilZ domain-containing protein [Acidobacteria bacterium]|nr:PilZ domain-containing protein [Acidobacteriota bacterium]
MDQSLRHIGIELQRTLDERRTYPRYTFEVSVTVYAKRAGRIPGQTTDLSETGVSAILVAELLIGEPVELEFELPLGLVRVRALVRNRNIFRYGFEFTDPAMEEKIKKSLGLLTMLDC